MMLDENEIKERFGHHKAAIEGPNPLTNVHSNLRVEYVEFAGVLVEMLPEGRELALALTALEEASMWSHKALARLSPREDPE